MKLKKLTRAHQKKTPRKNFELGIILQSEHKLIGGGDIRVTDARTKKYKRRMLLWLIFNLN